MPLPSALFKCHKDYCSMKIKCRTPKSGTCQNKWSWKGHFFHTFIVIYLKTFTGWKMVTSPFVTSDICLAIGSVLLENSLQFLSSHDWCPVKTELQRSWIWNAMTANAFPCTFEVLRCVAWNILVLQLYNLPWYQWNKLTIVYWTLIKSLSLWETFILSGCNRGFYSSCIHRLMLHALFISHFKYERSLVE